MCISDKYAFAVTKKMMLLWYILVLLLITLSCAEKVLE